MKVIRGQYIEEESISIDEKIFVGCTLVNCILEYSGSPVAFDRTQLRSCRYVFFGRAKRTVKFLQETGLMQANAAEWGEFSETVQ